MRSCVGYHGDYVRVALRVGFLGSVTVDLEDVPTNAFVADGP